MYNKAFLQLAEKGLVLLPPWPEGTDPCYHLYTLQVGAKCKVGRDELFRRLRDTGIYCQVHYIPIYRQPYYRERFGCALNRLSRRRKYYSSCLSLPLFLRWSRRPSIMSWMLFSISFNRSLTGDPITW